MLSEAPSMLHATGQRVVPAKFELLHFDAHPDLGAPTCPAEALWDPRELYPRPRSDARSQCCAAGRVLPIWNGS